MNEFIAASRLGVGVGSNLRGEIPLETPRPLGQGVATDVARIRGGWMNVEHTRALVESAWKGSVLATLREYIAIPNLSPGFDPQWVEHGHMEHAVDLITTWIRAQEVPGLQAEVVRLPGRSPLVFVEVAGASPATVLLYGHLDKQPPMDGWSEGLGPWTPVLRDGKLYGRGGADDGYAAFAAITAIGALKRQSMPIARCVVIIEACEESGSGDLPHYIEALKERIGTPELVVCLDSGCGNYDQLWMTVSLRGLLNGTLTVSTLSEGVHSGGAGGIVPSSFRIARQLLSRIEDENTGDLLVPELHVGIPSERVQQLSASVALMDEDMRTVMPFQPGARPQSDSLAELLINRAWRPQLEITGAAGLPPTDKAGNVLRPYTTLKLSVRLPPTADPARARESLKRRLEADPPYGAQVRFECEEAASGWNAPALAPWLEESANRASQAFFGRELAFMGEGGTIPFMAMLGRRFPQAQFLITGVLGPHSNAHGPNEFLHIDAATRLTSCVAAVLHDHFRALGS